MKNMECLSTALMSQTHTHTTLRETVGTTVGSIALVVRQRQPIASVITAASGCVCVTVLLRCKPALLNHGSSNGGANNNQVVSLSSPTEAFSVPITLPLLFIQQLHISSSLH